MHAGADLRGRLLIATPELIDRNFARSVVLICDHGDNGALGVILNRPTEADAAMFLPEWADHLTPPAVVFEGGPVQRETAVTLARMEEWPEGIETMPVAHGAGLIDISGGPDALGRLPADLRIFSGYAGWSVGQVEDEIGAGGWFVVESTPPDVFPADATGLWRRVLRRQGGRMALFADYPEDLTRELRQDRIGFTIPSMSVGTALLLLAGGFVAGFVNTVAGGGSVVTLPILVELVGASVANGTNRIAILLQNVVGVAGFQRGRAIPWRRVGPLIPAVVAGAVAGAAVATRVPPDVMRRVFAFVLVAVAASVLIKPSRWSGGGGERLAEPWRSALFFAIGFYGGFVQAGVGFLLLAGLVLGGGLDLVTGNAAKVLLVLIYTPVALLLFARAAQVDVAVGLVLAVGNMSGALVAATLAIRKGAGWIRWVIVVTAVAAALRMLLV